MDKQRIYEGQTVRYFEQGVSASKSAIGSGSSNDNLGTLAFVDRVHQTGALDLTIMTPQGIIQKTAIPEANWQPTEFSNVLNKSLQSA